MDFTKSMKMLLMNCSNPCNVLDKPAHSRIKPVNIVKEEMAIGLSRENSLEIDKTLEYFCNNDFCHKSCWHESKVKDIVSYDFIRKNVPPHLKQVALVFLNHSKN